MRLCNNTFEEKMNQAIIRKIISKSTNMGYKHGSNRSKAEIEIEEYIRQIYNKKIESNNKSIIRPQELDLYLPDLDIAIEYNGLYWHSDIYKDKNYHYNKFNRCLQKGIHLNQIFEDEWENDKDIIKQYLKELITIKSKKIHVSNVDIKPKSKIIELKWVGPCSMRNVLKNYDLDKTVFKINNRCNIWYNHISNSTPELYHTKDGSSVYDSGSKYYKIIKL